MKKILSLVVLAFLSVFTVMAQGEQFVSTEVSNKNVVLEEYTGINCGYCPDGHKRANQLAAANPGRVFVINIHAGGYAANTYTTQHGNTLQTTFGANSFPTGTVNRHTFTGYSQGNFLMSRGDWASAASTIMSQTSPVNIAARGTLDWSTRELNITVQLYYTADEANATNKLNVAILQDNVIGSQSGANLNPAQQVGSQYRHMHMFRGFVYNNAWGEDITTTTQGSFVEKTYTYTIPANLGSPTAIPAKLEDLHFVAFVAQGQQEILTGCEVEIENINMPALSARIDGLNNIEVMDCSTDARVSASVTNVGSDAITSLTFQYSVANGTPMTFDWTGNIASMDNTSIELPTLTVATNTNQVIKAKVVSANGQAFESDEVSVTIKKSVVSGDGPMVLKIKTDTYASETSYKLYGPNNNVIQQSSSFTNSTIHTFDLNFPSPGCYRLQVKDSYGDGISGGFVRIFAADGTTQLFNATGTSFSSELNVMISVETVDIDDETFQDMIIFPNPATNFVNIQGTANIQQVELFNLEGQRVAAEYGDVRTLSLEGLASGMYIMKVTSDKGTTTYKVSKR
ncbi:MAG: Omp28-related outer membrane protein [Bacteroidales bacterium]|nr:Omp28-related outer membrane protein [Bacteroidales bacterium]